MPYIAEVYLRGFQSHVESLFKLGPGLNVITGPTDSGKTSLLRAIRWVAFGEPAGEQFVNLDVGHTEVVIRLSDGTVVGKRRRKGKTSYDVTLPGQDEPGTIFEKAEVPAEVTAALGLTTQKFGVLEFPLNFSYQLDEPFLISKPPSNGAVILGKLAGTEIVDLAIKAVAKDTYHYNEERSAAKKAIEQKKKDLAEYDDLDDQKAQLEAALALVAKIEAALAKRATLAGLQAAYQKATENRATAQATVDRLAIVETLAADAAAIEVALCHLMTLQSLNAEHWRHVQRLSHLEELLGKLAAVPALAAEAERLDAAIGRQFRLNALYVLRDTQLQVRVKAEAVLQATANLPALAATADWLAEAIAKADKLRGLAADYRAVAENKTRLENLARHLAPVDEAAALVPQISANVDRLQRLRDLRATYQSKRATLDDAQRRERQATDDLRRCQNELTATWAEIGVCPLCEQTYKGATA